MFMSEMLKLTVVIPTYQEVLNIPLISQQIVDAIAGRFEFEILFVDDNSQDGSVEAVAKLTAKGLPVRIEVRTEERGLSTAVIHGARHARGEYVAVMDADLSHPATALMPMLTALESQQADFCVGSRYVKGGSFDKDWGFFRLLNSKIATWLAMPLCSIKDPMSGFFAFQRKRLPKKHLLSPLGYKIGLEILIKGRFSKPLEIPIHFSDRQHGESKLDFKEQLRYLRHLRRLYTFKYPAASEFVQFGLVGGTGFLIDSLAYFSMLLSGVSHEIARGIAFWPAVTWNWFWNRTVTFTDRRKDSKLKQWASFMATSGVGFMINFGSYYLLTHYVPFFMKHTYPALIVGVLLGMGFNFMAARVLVFRPLEKEVLEDDASVTKTDEGF
jgi:dolichol-phosphate mannosyltransferase